MQLDGNTHLFGSMSKLSHLLGGPIVAGMLTACHHPGLRDPGARGVGLALSPETSPTCSDQATDERTTGASERVA